MQKAYEVTEEERRKRLQRVLAKAEEELERSLDYSVAYRRLREALVEYLNN